MRESTRLAAKFHAISMTKHVKSIWTASHLLQACVKEFIDKVLKMNFHEKGDLAAQCGRHEMRLIDLDAASRQIFVFVSSQAMRLDQVHPRWWWQGHSPLDPPRQGARGAWCHEHLNLAMAHGVANGPITSVHLASNHAIVVWYYPIIGTSDLWSAILESFRSRQPHFIIRVYRLSSLNCHRMEYTPVSPLSLTISHYPSGNLT